MTLTFSNSHMWSVCAASVHPHPAPVPIEHERSEAQQEGEAAAWLANLVLRGTAASTMEAEGETAPNGWPIDYEMIRHVQRYVELVTRHGPVESEQDLEIFAGRVRGRPDCHTVGADDVLRVYELKYGYRIVEPQGNTQMLCAAIALVRPHHRLVSLEVFQPRAAHANGPHRKYVLGLDELEGWHVDLEAAAKATLIDRPIATVTDQCEFCSRRAACHALASAVYQDFDRIRSRHKARALTAEEIGAERTFLEGAMKRLEARLSGIRKESDARVRTGEFVPGWSLTGKYGNRAFTAEPAIVKMLTGIDPHKPVMKSPAELEREGANPDIVERLTHRPFIGMELKPWDEKKVAKAFERTNDE